MQVTPGLRNPPYSSMSISGVGRTGSTGLSNGPKRWATGSVASSKKSSGGYSDVFDDLRAPRPVHSSVSKVYSVNASMKYTNAHVLRYGTTRSMPDHNQHDQHHHAVSNGHATTGRRMYSTNTRKPTSHKVFAHGGTFRRSTPEVKENAISFFDIEMEKSPFYQYRPGEQISGAVHMDVHHNLEIRFVELVIVGQGTITVRKAKQGMPSTVREIYIKKQTYVIGTGDSVWSSLLTPGHYLSKFRFRLPKELPSSISHDDLSSGFTMDINYYVEARICDDVGNSSFRSTSSSGQLVKVLMSKKQPFRVQRHFDLNQIPNSSDPVTHTEEVYLSCAGHNLVRVTLNLERVVFLAGDDIKLQLAASVPQSQRVKAISCRLRQHLKLDDQPDVTTFTLFHAERVDPQSTSQIPDELSYEVTIPTQTNLVTSFLQGCKMVHISYSLAIEMRFAPAGGKLSFTIPLGIGPCAEPIYAEKISSRKAVPIFNRPTRFPCFSPTPAKTPLQVDRSSRSSQSINVITKYSNSFWAKCFLCCFMTNDVD